MVLMNSDEVGRLVRLSFLCLDTMRVIREKTTLIFNPSWLQGLITDVIYGRKNNYFLSTRILSLIKLYFIQLHAINT